jgi:hypothetical protein
VLVQPSPDSWHFLRPRPVPKEQAKMVRTGLFATAGSRATTTPCGGVERSSRLCRDDGAETRENSRQMPRTVARRVCEGSGGRSNREADNRFSPHESPPERDRSRRFRTTRRLNSLRYRPSLAPTFCRQHSHNAEHTVQRPPEFMFRIRGVLRKQGNYVVVVIKFGRGLQEGEEKYFQARSIRVANVERRSKIGAGPPDRAGGILHRT